MTEGLASVAEERIQEALLAGADRDLPGSGKPFDLEAYFSAPPSLRAGFGFLKSAGVVPPEVEALREVHRLRELLAKATDPKQIERLQAELRLRDTEAAMAMERMRRIWKTDMD